ncbi:condensation domain-containing protein [Streptomyces sp. NPDC048514]|uniref:condensation domain-containing protein n=1 Tax=Streptomyces sp. NPDC048514 TaxID=3365564 RepID=UPI003713A57B
MKRARRLDGTAVPADGPALLSYGQEQLWALFRYFPDSSSSYNMSRVYRLDGEVDAQALQFAIDELVDRHESLRTAVRETGDGLRRVISGARAELCVEDVRHLPDDQRYESARLLCRNAVAREFELEHAPLMRALLVRMADSRWLFVLVVHHIVCDGWSWAIIHRELSAAYGAAVSGRADARAARLVRPYSAFVTQQRGRRQDAEFRRSLGFWVDYLRDIPPASSIPEDKEMDPPNFLGDSHVVRLGEKSSDAVRRAAVHHGVTAPTVLLAAFARLMQEEYGHDEVVLALPLANRIGYGMDDTVGYFVNTHAIRIRAAENPGAAGLMAETGRQLADAFRHQEVPPMVVEEELLKTSAGDQIALAFQTMFVSLGQQRVALELDGAEVSFEPGFRTGRTKNDLALITYEVDREIVCHFEYRTDLYEEGTIAGAAEAYRRILAGLTRLPAGE